MLGEVSLRFIKCLEYLKLNNKIPSTRQFAQSISIHPQCISDVVRGKREVNCDILFKAIQQYNLNPIYLYTGEGSVLLNDSTQSFNHDPIITIVTDNTGSERIVYVPISAQAGYGQQLHDPIFIQNLPTFNLPGFQYSHGTFRCFDVSGDSMEPSIYNGEKVICSFVERDNWFNGIKENHVYVIITKESVVVKRVINKLKESGTLELVSDNNFYEPYDIELKDVVEVWNVKEKISPFHPSPRNIRNGLHNEVDHLKVTIADQSRLIKSLNATVEKLLKANRTSSVR